MAGITTATCNSFKQELLTGVHVFGTDVFKVALIQGTPTGTYDAATTNYSNVTGNNDEVVGAGYTVGGQALTPTVNLQAGVATIDFAQVQWLASSITSLGCIIYNSSKSNKAVCVVNWGGVFQDVNGVFLIQWPASGAATSQIQIA